MFKNKQLIHIEFLNLNYDKMREKTRKCKNI